MTLQLPENMLIGINWVATDVAKKMPGTKYWKGTIYTLWEMVSKEMETSGFAMRYEAFRPNILQFGRSPYPEAALYLVAGTDPDNLALVDTVVLVDGSRPRSTDEAHEYMTSYKRTSTTCRFCRYQETTDHGRARLQIYGSDHVHKGCLEYLQAWQYAASQHTKVSA